MRTVLLSTLTLGAAVSSVAVAEPVRPTEPAPAGLAQPSAATPIPLGFVADPSLRRLPAAQVEAVPPVPLGPDVRAEPVATEGARRIQLSATQMDVVTAGLVAINVTAAAAARGPYAFAGTSTETYAASGKWIEVAYGVGDAYAVGDEAIVDVATSVYGEGDYVTGGSFRFVVNGPGYVRGYTAGFVIAIHADHPKFYALRPIY